MARTELRPASPWLSWGKTPSSLQGKEPTVPDQPSNPSEPDPDEDRPSVPPEIAEVLRNLTGGADLPPELAQALQSMGIGNLDPGTLSMVAAQVQAMFSGPAGEPFDTALATDVARKTVASAGDHSCTVTDARQVADAAQVAALWLDEVTSLTAPAAQARAWSRAEWVEATMPAWSSLVEPVATGVTAAIGDAMRSQIERLGAQGLPEGMVPAGVDPAALLGQLQPMLARMSSSMFGLQTGQAIGALADDVVSGTEVGLPLVPGQAVALLPANVASFAEGLQVDADQVRLYVAVRESARVRLFADVAWLGPQLMAAVRDYAGDISFDTERIESQLQSVDPSDPQALQAALQDNLFTPEPSASGRAALSRLETYLALVEGWVDVVTDRATRGHLPQASALGEAVRRRRAEGGPAERTFANLVGLELRPRRLRDAANLWAALEARHGTDVRDGAWAHPDLAPTAGDLDDPLGYVERVTGQRAGGDDVDAALERMLRGDTGAG